MTSSHQKQPLARVVCDHTALKFEITRGLETEGITCCTNGLVTLIVDTRPGVAPKTLKSFQACQCVVLSDNLCPEYLENLWDQGIAGLLTHGHRISEIAHALRRTFERERFRSGTNTSSILTPRQRTLLRLCAEGMSNANIGDCLEISAGVVRNSLSEIFSRLNLSNRHQATLYYWGLWDILEQQGWNRPDMPLVTPKG